MARYVVIVDSDTSRPPAERIIVAEGNVGGDSEKNIAIPFKIKLEILVLGLLTLVNYGANKQISSKHKSLNFIKTKLRNGL
jgi:hypothetical protein